jgi:hypothetical protein
MKQTAVDWLFKEIYGDTGHIGSYTTDGKDAFEAFEKAKAMEREQTKDAYKVGFNYRDEFNWEGDSPWEDKAHFNDNEQEFQKYYNETYKGGEK